MDRVDAVRVRDLLAEQTDPAGSDVPSGTAAPGEPDEPESRLLLETMQIAVFAINAPWGNPPANWIFFRDPTALRFYRK